MKARLIMVGPPGAGKGTQAKTLTAELGIPNISTGAIFRENMANNTELGLQAQQYMNAGNLVPDEITNAMVRDRLAQPDAAEGFLLDGYPRNAAQVEELDKILADMGTQIDAVVELDIPDDAIVDRLLKRAAMEKRADDTEDVIRHRIEVYHDETEPVVSAYAERDMLLKVDGQGDIEEIRQRIVQALNERLS